MGTKDGGGADYQLPLAGALLPVTFFSPLGKRKEASGGNWPKIHRLATGPSPIVGKERFLNDEPQCGMMKQMSGTLT